LNKGLLFQRGGIIYVSVLLKRVFQSVRGKAGLGESLPGVLGKGNFGVSKRRYIGRKLPYVCSTCRSSLKKIVRGGRRRSRGDRKEEAEGSF